MCHRRKAREYALQGLYIFEVSKSPLIELTSLDWVEDEVPEDIQKFTVSLITNTIENITEIDKVIQKHSKNWKFERLSYVDKSILRLSISEMMYMADIPYAVTINEGIELGKIFGGENSGQFINGILDAVNREYSKK